MHEFPTVLHAVASHAETIPDKVAIIEAETDRKCTYSELWSYVKAFSKRLVKAGVVRDFGDGYGTRVVVRCTQTIDFMITALAVQLAGGVFVPVEKNIADARIIQVMEETDSKILIAVKPLSKYGYLYINISEASIEQNKSIDENIIFPKPNILANILFTTGTTGRSKGVMQSHKSFIAMFLFLYFAVNHNSEDVWLIPSPLSHNAGLGRVFGSMYLKSTVVLLDGYVIIKSFFDAIFKYKVTSIILLYAVTGIYLQMCRDELVKMSKQIKKIYLVGSSFSELQVSSLRKIFYNSTIAQSYGATEIIGCFVIYSQHKYNSFCVGQPFNETELAFFDEQKNNIINASREEPGLFALNNDSKMLGYWKNKELTASVTRGDYIILSDFGYKGDDGLFYFLSRADDVIISGGYKIAPIEIEEVANAFDSILESVCIPINDPIMGQIPKLYVVMKKNYIFNFNDIYNFLKNKLETTRIPRYIEEIEEIPKINNKINRKEIKNK